METLLVKTRNNMRRNDDLVGVGIQPLDALITMQNLAPLADWSQLSESDHFVHFYETDRFLIDLLSHFIGTGLSAGDACLVVATKAHREDLDERLTASGVDVAAAKACGQFLSLDAAETLSKFLVDGSPEPERFKEVVGGLLAQAAVGRGVRAFGEMVALLWAQGNHSGAIRLEALWNELRRTQPFSLFCAYPVNSFAGETMTAQLSGVCGEHTCVIPAESYTALVDADDRLRAIALLQQKARLLETEIAERKAAEARLREQAEMIETINRAGQALSAELNLQNVVQVVTDASTELTGAQFGAFFYNVIDHSGESYMLYSLSGVPREAFAHFPMPRNTDLFGQTFRGDGIIRIADVKQDPRYGKNSPYYGMPRGHLPVTSYLAIPVISRAGQVLGGLFFGHPHENVFTERHERLIEGLAAQAAIAMDNAQLYELSQRERAKAEAANRAKDEFLATVSHELRTPLNAIIGWSHMLRRGRLDEATVSRAVETIERNAKSQAQLIEDILDVSRVITGKLRLKVGPVDIVSVISAAIDSVQLAADSKSIKLGVILDPSARHISGDASRLQQVVWNLLSNAIKFTPAGGQVEVRLERAGANAKIVVSDTGEGISEDFLPFIFDRFRQADGSLTRRQGGLGLGLAIVKHLIELHGGAVYADSAGAGRGATFT
ncbi:MAG: hypothetical protein V7641_1176, partial [Blastocatellia bacterium]